MKIIFKSLSKLNDGIDSNNSVSCDISEGNIDVSNCNPVFSTFFNFLIRKGMDIKDINHYLIILAENLKEAMLKGEFDEDLECTSEDCENCEFYDDCNYKDEVFEKTYLQSLENNLISKEDNKNYDDNNVGVENEETIKELVKDPAYRKKFLDSLNTNSNLLDLVLRTYLYAVFENNVRLDENELN